MEVPGEDSSLLCYYKSDSTYSYRLIALREGVWQTCQQWNFKYVFLDGYVSCNSFGLTDSKDRYVIVSPGTSSDSKGASLTWHPSDKFGTDYYKAIYLDGRSAQFYARIPADTEPYNLQISDAWCIENISFQNEWWDTFARRVPMDG